MNTEPFTGYQVTQLYKIEIDFFPKGNKAQKKNKNNFWASRETLAPREKKYKNILPKQGEFQKNFQVRKMELIRPLGLLLRVADLELKQTG